MGIGEETHRQVCLVARKFGVRRRDLMGHVVENMGAEPALFEAWLEADKARPFLQYRELEGLAARTYWRLSDVIDEGLVEAWAARRRGSGAVLH
jgi:hypothetical protein